jgi:predicted nuclease of predicted toxin-antitoxin system
MRVLLDENVDRRLKNFFDEEYEVITVTERGWRGKKNGELLSAAEREFDVLVSVPKCKTEELRFHAVMVEGGAEHLEITRV